MRQRVAEGCGSGSACLLRGSLEGRGFGHRDANPDEARVGEFEGVVDEVGEDLSDAKLVPQNLQQAGNENMMSLAFDSTDRLVVCQSGLRKIYFQYCQVSRI